MRQDVRIPNGWRPTSMTDSPEDGDMIIIYYKLQLEKFITY